MALYRIEFDISDEEVDLGEDVTPTIDDIEKMVKEALYYAELPYTGSISVTKQNG